MMRRFVDHLLAVTKESVKTFTYESLNNVVRLINGASALVLAFLPGKTTILEGVQGWELRPTLRGPRLPRWMENGVSSFNKFIHELSVVSDTSSNEYMSGEDDDADLFPASPSSHVSNLSRTSSFRRNDRNMIQRIKYLISWMLLPLILPIKIPYLLLHRSWSSGYETNSSGNTMRPSTNQQRNAKDHLVNRATDRRRGVVEDLQLVIEVFIEAVFDMVHKAAHFLLSPSDIFRLLSGWFAFHADNCQNGSAEVEVVVPIATLGDANPTPTEKQTTFNRTMNTDARTCADVIRELGYPYEAIQVVTSDGYVLLLERIPRRDSRKVVYLQHGVLDSSMGWVSNGVVGSPAFAAFDQGYDVFLGNFRGLVSREHVDKNISSRMYWKYSINEHGTEDVPAMIGKIHEIKTAELIGESCEEEIMGEQQPYKLCSVSHSLGGAVMLMYAITRGIARKPHRLSRLILLSPAGFHEDSTFAFTVAEHVFLWAGPLLAPFVPGLYIPTRFFRMLVNKLARDLHNYPALGGLVQTLMGYVVGGDSSNWIGVIGLPHYNMHDMPGVSLRVAIHLAQMKRTGRFAMYDFGSSETNLVAYGSPEPLDLGQHYDQLVGLPVDLVAGCRDQVIRPSMVRKHYRLLKRAGVAVTYNEFEYAHLDFTFSHREELLAYVMSRLLLVSPSNTSPSSPDQKTLKSRSAAKLNRVKTEPYEDGEGEEAQRSCS